MTAADRQEEELGFYERLLREAAQEEEKENPEREKQQERMRAYVRSRSRADPAGGGYVTSEEMREKQERYLADLRALLSLMINGSRATNGSYRLAYLKRKYPTEYAHLRDIEISSRSERLSRYLASLAPGVVFLCDLSPAASRVRGSARGLWRRR